MHRPGIVQSGYKGDAAGLEKGQMGGFEGGFDV